jgi:hypothetical protein
MIGIFGDWIFGAPDGTLWHLDLLEGQFHQVAGDSTEFNSKKREEKYRDEWFGANWADIALGTGWCRSTMSAWVGRSRRSLAVHSPSKIFKCFR